MRNFAGTAMIKENFERIGEGCSGEDQEGEIFEKVNLTEMMGLIIVYRCLWVSLPSANPPMTLYVVVSSHIFLGNPVLLLSIAYMNASSFPNPRGSCLCSLHSVEVVCPCARAGSFLLTARLCLRREY